MIQEQLHTIPIHDAFKDAGECPFCYIERRLEERMMDFVLGPSSSYMEADIRDQTDRAGFCRQPFEEDSERVPSALSAKSFDRNRCQRNQLERPAL